MTAVLNSISISLVLNLHVLWKIIMNRNKFIVSILALYPMTILAKYKIVVSELLKKGNNLRTTKGFKVNSGAARYGIHYKMKGVTLNTLDLKISANDTVGDLAVFEQTGLTPKGGPPLHIHPLQDEWFYVVEGEYHFQVGEDKYSMKAGDTIFLPRNIKHAFIQLSEKGKMIVSYLPAGKMEAFFKVTDSWTSPPSQEEITKVFEEHDMKIVGAPLKID